MPLHDDPELAAAMAAEAKKHREARGTERQNDAAVMYETPPRRSCTWEPSHTVQVGERAHLLWSASRIDPTKVPPPGSLLGKSFCQKFISGTIGPGGAGKTAVRCVQYLAAASGRSLTGEHIHHRCRVLIVGLEDDLDEMERRLCAARLHHGVDPSEFEDQIMYFCPRGERLMRILNGAAVPADLYESLRACIQEIKPDIVSLDPFIKAAGVEENDNNLIDQVCTLLAGLADEFNIAIDLLSHTRKGTMTPGDPDADRGASSKRDAGRLMRTLTPMSADEAQLYEVKPEDRRTYARLDDAKVNIVRSDAEMWFHLAGVDLGNQTDAYRNGDNVQAAERWYPPKAFDGVTIAMACTIIDDIDKGLPNGQRYSAATAAKNRAAWKVVQSHLPDKSPAHCRQVINGWRLTGVLTEETYHNAERREDEQGLFANPAKRPGTHHDGMPD